MATIDNVKAVGICICLAFGRRARSARRTARSAFRIRGPALSRGGRPPLAPWRPCENLPAPLLRWKRARAGSRYLIIIEDRRRSLGAPRRRGRANNCHVQVTCIYVSTRRSVLREPQAYGKFVRSRSAKQTLEFPRSRGRPSLSHCCHVPCGGCDMDVENSKVDIHGTKVDWEIGNLDIGWRLP